MGISEQMMGKAAFQKEKPKKILKLPNLKNIQNIKSNKPLLKKIICIVVIFISFLIVVNIIMAIVRKIRGRGASGMNEELKILNSLDKDKLEKVKNYLFELYNTNHEVNLNKFQVENIEQKEYSAKDTGLTNIHISTSLSENRIQDVIIHLTSAIQKMSSSSFLHIHIMSTDNFTLETFSKLMSMAHKTNNNTEIIKIPPYLLDVDDLALLLNINDSGLIPVLEKTLSYVYIFKSNDDICKKYKNDIIAKCFLDLLSSGKPPQQIRDQVIAFLSKYNTEEINLETIISQPGLNRTIRQCLNIDPQGKMLALELLVSFLKKYSEVNIDNIIKTPTEYSFDDIYYAMEFAIVSEGAFNNSVIYEKVNQLKTRLHSFINSENKQYFEYQGFISLENYVKKLFMTGDSENAQIVDVNFNYIDDRLAKNLVKIFSKMFYKYTVNLEDRGSYPLNIIIEEAHRYIQKDNDIEILGYNIFDRIAKEGRKYGLLLGLITQRISELSSTVLSQCSNFIIFRMYYPEDIKIVSSIASNVTMDAIEKLKSLSQGMALVFGTSFKIPLITYFDIPDPMPTSTSVNINEKWYQ